MKSLHLSIIFGLLKGTDIEPETKQFLLKNELEEEFLYEFEQNLIDSTTEEGVTQESKHRTYTTEQKTHLTENAICFYKDLVRASIFCWRELICTFIRPERVSAETAEHLARSHVEEKILRIFMEKFNEIQTTCTYSLEEHDKNESFDFNFFTDQVHSSNFVDLYLKCPHSLVKAIKIQIQIFNAIGISDLSSEIFESILDLLLYDPNDRKILSDLRFLAGSILNETMSHFLIHQWWKNLKIKIFQLKNESVEVETFFDMSTLMAHGSGKFDWILTLNRSFEKILGKRRSLEELIRQRRTRRNDIYDDCVNLIGKAICFVKSNDQDRVCDVLDEKHFHSENIDLFRELSDKLTIIVPNIVQNILDFYGTENLPRINSQNVTISLIGRQQLVSECEAYFLGESIASRQVRKLLQPHFGPRYLPFECEMSRFSPIFQCLNACISLKKYVSKNLLEVPDKISANVHRIFTIIEPDVEHALQMNKILNEEEKNALKSSLQNIASGLNFGNSSEYRFISHNLFLANLLKEVRSENKSKLSLEFSPYSMKYINYKKCEECGRKFSENQWKVKNVTTLRIQESVSFEDLVRLLFVDPQFKIKTPNCCPNATFSKEEYHNKCPQLLILNIRNDDYLKISLPEKISIKSRVYSLKSFIVESRDFSLAFVNFKQFWHAVSNSSVFKINDINQIIKSNSEVSLCFYELDDLDYENCVLI